MTRDPPELQKRKPLIQNKNKDYILLLYKTRGRHEELNEKP